MRDLAMFNLAIDSKLRDCDLIWVRIDDVCAGGRVRDRATVVQKKTGRPPKHSNGVAAWSRSMTFTSGRRPRKAVFRQISFSTKHYRSSIGTSHGVKSGKTFRALHVNP